MTSGEFITRLTIWLALIAYAIGVSLMLLARRRVPWLQAARIVWTFGCAFFLVHVAFAFAVFHGWSHADAYRETARQTEAMTGFKSGFGLYLNYVFGIVWIIDVACWWASHEKFLQRPAWLTKLWQGFLLFMVFNGTVIFGKGPVRWLGVVICASLVGIWWSRRSAARRMAKRNDK